jgi:thiol:disulfide interchange protein
MTAYVLQALSAFVAGLGTSLSPCVYPIIPITIGYLGATGAKTGETKGKILSFFIGQVMTFTLLGVAAVLLGEILGFSSEIPAVQIGTGALLIVFALSSFFEKLPSFLYKLNTPSFQKSADTIVGAFVVGAASAAVASPCTSPVIGGMLAAISQVKERVWGISLMFFFAVGLSFLFLVLGLGLAKVSKMPRAGLWMRKVHKASSVILALGGLYFILRGFQVL